MTTQHRHPMYKQLYNVLAKHNLAAITNYLLDNATVHASHMDLRISDLRRLKLIPREMKAIELRNILWDLKLLRWTGHDYGIRQDKCISYEILPRLAKLLLRNAEKISGKESVLYERVLRLEEKIEVLEKENLGTKAEMCDMWEAIRNIEENNPPVTEEKLRRHLTLVKD